MATKPKTVQKAEPKQPEKPDPRTELLRRKAAQKGHVLGRGQQRRFV